MLVAAKVRTAGAFETLAQVVGAIGIARTLVSDPFTNSADALFVVTAGVGKTWLRRYASLEALTVAATFAWITVARVALADPFLTRD